MIRRTTNQHYNKYETMYQEAKAKGWLVDKLARYIAVPTIDEWVGSSLYLLPQSQDVLDKDPTLNYIPLARFDAYYYVMRRHFPTASLAENTCLLKHALIYHVMGCEFEEETR